MKISKYISSILFPHKCTFCKTPIEYNNMTFICHDCKAKLPYITGSRCIKCNTPQNDYALPICYTCRRNKHSFSGSFTPLLYKDSVRKSILSMKFYNKESFCRSYAYLIANSIASEGFPSIDFVTFIPLSPERLKERGYNQAELIARFCAEILNLPVVDSLYRINGTPKQSGLSLPERRKNAKKSFFSKNLTLKGTALLIDDIYTTGSTLNYTSSLLLKMGCDKVYISAIAMTEKF